MAYDREIIEEIKANSGPIFENFLETRLSRRENPVKCLFHGEDHRPSMSVNVEKGLFNCLACGAAGDVITFVKRLEGCSFPAALRLCCDIAGIERHEARKNDPSVVLKREQRLEEAEILSALRAWHGKMAMLKAAKVYDLEHELQELSRKASCVSEERKREQPLAFRLVQERLSSLPGVIVRAEEDFDDFQAASKDLALMARLFEREYGLERVDEGVRSFAAIISDAFSAAGDGEINPSQLPRVEQALALSLLRQVPNEKLLEHLGRGWYTDVLLSDDSPEPTRDDTHERLFAAAPQDRAHQGSRDAGRGEGVERRALARRAQEAVQRAGAYRAGLKASGERIAAALREGFRGKVDVG